MKNILKPNIKNLKFVTHSMENKNNYKKWYERLVEKENVTV